MWEEVRWPRWVPWLCYVNVSGHIISNGKLALHLLLQGVVVASVIPVIEKHWAEIDVVFGVVRRAVDDHSSVDAASVLGRVMGMIKGRAVEIGSESVCQVLTGCDRALLCAGHAIVIWRLVLQKAVPVDRGTLIGKLVVDSDFKVVTPVCGNCWARVATVHLGSRLGEVLCWRLM